MKRQEPQPALCLMQSKALALCAFSEVSAKQIAVYGNRSTECVDSCWQSQFRCVSWPQQWQPAILHGAHTKPIMPGHLGGYNDCLMHTHWWPDHAWVSLPQWWLLLSDGITRAMSCHAG